MMMGGLDFISLTRPRLLLLVSRKTKFTPFTINCFNPFQNDLSLRNFRLGLNYQLNE